MMSISGMGAGMWLLMAAGTIGFWALVTMLVCTLFRGDSGGAEAAVVPSPLHVLADRLASGEITIEEYEMRRRVLTGGVAPFARPDLSPIAPTEPSAASSPDPTKDRYRSS